jgi:uncharacterized integral membrane protein
MAILGLLLMLACAAAAVDVVVQDTGPVTLTIFNQHVTGLSLGALLIAGAVVGILFALGLAMFTGGVGRSVRRRREHRVLRTRAREENGSLREENERLRARLDERDGAHDVYPDDEVGQDTDSRGIPVDDAEGGRHREESGGRFRA